VARRFPRVLVHGPLRYQGLGIPDLFVSQGIVHIEKMIMFGTSPESFTGKLLRASMELHLRAEKINFETNNKLDDSMEQIQSSGKWKHLSLKNDSRCADVNNILIFVHYIFTYTLIKFLLLTKNLFRDINKFIS